jgi:hypothetical protein
VTIHLGPALPSVSSSLPGSFRTGSPQTLLYLALHRMGFAKLTASPPTLVSSYLTLSPLPVYVTLSAQLRRGKPLWVCLGEAPRAKPGGLLSVALSLGLPPVGVTDHPALWCSDFPPGFIALLHNCTVVNHCGSASAKLQEPSRAVTRATSQL